MQLIESVLILLVLVQLVFLFINKKEKQSLAFIGLGLLVFHFVLGEARWQMGFIYFIEIVLMAIYLKKIKSAKWISVIGCFFASIFTAISAILVYALPVFSLPETSGTHKVGLKQIHIKVDTREETITTDQTDKRELMVNVWYPTSDEIDNPIQYLPEVERTGFATKYGLPEGALGYLSKVKTQSQLNATPAEGSFPVLVFSPGYYTPASGYLSIIEDLVSHGYVIFNIIHPHETMGIEYPDGRQVFFNQAFSDANSWGWNDQTAKAAEVLQNSEDDGLKRAAVQQMVQTYGKAIVKRWAADIENVIDELHKLNMDASFPLHSQLNMDQLGVYGHSAGGAAAIEAAIFDERIKAAVNLDGAQWGSLMDNPLNKPGALISSSDMAAQLNPNKYIFEKSLGQDFYNLVLNNSGHSSFSDIPFMISVPQLTEAGSISPEIASSTTTQFLNAFFGQYLLNQDNDLNGWLDSNGYLMGVNQ